MKTLVRSAALAAVASAALAAPVADPAQACKVGASARSVSPPPSFGELRLAPRDLRHAHRRVVRRAVPPDDLRPLPVHVLRRRQTCAPAASA